MPLRAKFYKDKERLLVTRNAHRNRYYRKTQNALNKNTRWTIFDIELVLKSDFTDTELSKKIGRSVAAIQRIRHRYK